MKIVIDSSFLLHTFSLGINFTAALEDLDIQYELFVPRAVIAELEKHRLKRKKFASLALQVIKKHSIIINNVQCNQMTADECVLETAKQIEASAIATTDRELKKKAWQLGFLCLYIRGKSRYELAGPPL